MPEAIRHSIRKVRWNLGVVFVLLLIGCAPVASPAQALAVTDELGTKWLDVSIGPETVAWFNTHAQPNDIARIDHLNMLNLLGELTTGQRLVVVKSIAEAEQVLESVGEQVDIIGYNLEHGPGNLPVEQANPVGSTRRMRALADQYGVKLAVGPDRAFALSDGVAMAAYADLLILQVQRVQDEPETVRDFILPMVDAVHDVAPDVQIGVQIGADGDVTDMISLLNSMSGEVNGISILTDHISTEFLNEFLTAVRPPQAVIQTPTLTPKATIDLPLSLTPTVETMGTITGSKVVTELTGELSHNGSEATRNVSVATAEMEARDEIGVGNVWLTRMVWAGWIVLSILVGGVMITVVLYTWTQRRVR